MRAVAIAVVVAVLAGCAAAPPAPPAAPLLYSISPAGSEHSSLDADSTGERAGRGAATGAGVGAGGGALLSLICGPWALLCLGPFAGGGALVGAVGGSMHGFTGLSREDAERVEALLGPLDERRDFTRELADALRERVPPEQRAAPGQDAVDIRVEIDRIELVQHAGDALELALSTRMRVTRTGRGGHRTYRYRHATGSRPLEAWLANDGAMLDAGLGYCVRKTVESMQAEIGL